MCGIYAACVTGASKSLAATSALAGLARLEYRGYDSAGIAGSAGGKIVDVRAVGGVSGVAQAAESTDLGPCVIAHTRWATHGQISPLNAHPIPSPSRRYACVHNGIIENYHALKKELEGAGAEFETGTDTEVIVQFAEQLGQCGMQERIGAIAQRLSGRSSFVLIDAEHPDEIGAASLGTSLVLGLGAGMLALASDSHGFGSDIEKIAHVPLGHRVHIKGGIPACFNQHGDEVQLKWLPYAADEAAAHKGEHAHYMLKEIHEQPELLMRLLKEGAGSLPKAERIYVIGCGSSWHVAGVAAEWIERGIGRPARAEIASEFRYGPSLCDEQTLVVAISQSGETADTLAAVERAKEKGARVVALSNTTSSSLQRLADHHICLQAGPEIGVASTKTFTASLARLWEMVGGALPLLGVEVGHLLERSSQITEAAEQLSSFNHVLCIGRGVMHWIARESALKIKELAYIHASAYAAGELKHGPIALIDEACPTIAFCSRAELAPKMVSSLMEISVRGGPAWLIAPQRLAPLFEGSPAKTLFYPSSREEHDPFIASVVAQLLAYGIAEQKGRSIDQPRNLAKSVTVE